MTKARLETFSDGVIAIIMTVMVLELKTPHTSDLASLSAVAPTLVTYLLSFVYLGIYWNNHHHMFHAVKHVSGGVLWANMHLLFWLSLVPFVTAWMGGTTFDNGPVLAYGLVLLGAAVAYTILTTVLVNVHGKDSNFAKRLGSDFKGKISLVLYLIGIALSAIQHYVACAFYAVVALIWLVPDRRFEATDDV